MADLLELTLKTRGTTVKFPEGKTLFSEGDPCANFLVVKSGQIKVFKISEKGREIVLYRVAPDNLCVLTTSSLLAGSTYPANGITETAVEAVALDKAAFDRLIVESQPFRELVFQSLSSRFSTFVEKIDEVVFHTLKERLLVLLHRAKNDSATIAITHQELAAELGTEREVVSRVLKQLEQAGQIRLAKGAITLLE